MVPPIGHRFKPGQSGNPGGRPKGLKYLSEHLRELAQKFCKNPDHEHDGKLTNDECVAWAIVKAAQGDFSKGGKPDTFAVQIYAERTEGKVKEVVELRQESKMPEKSDEEVAAMLRNKGQQA